MKTKSLILSAVLGFVGLGTANATVYVGGDISMLPTFEAAGSKYYTNSGQTISDFVTYSYDQGMNAMRVRLFVDPDTFIQNLGSGAENWQKRACQSYDYILPLCKKIKNAGHKLLLDFHYSDTWADPANQWTPKSWESLSASETYNKIYEYTKDVLTNLQKEGCEPDFIQTGNEISYGMCWGPYSTKSKNYYVYISTNDSKRTYFQNLLQNAIKACREVCPDAKIVLHTERVPNISYTAAFYDWAKSCGLDYDIIGLSYYFYYHGALTQLDSALSTLEGKNYGKKIWIVETGAPYKYAMNGTYDNLYGLTDSEQNRYTTELLEVIEKHSSVNGIFWWDMNYNPYGANTSKYPFIQDWYNASIFDNSTGRALSSFATLAAWAKKMNENASEDDWNTGNGGSGNGDDDETDTDYYLLYNNNGSASWATPGTKFSVNEEGIYYLTDLNISQTGSDYGWFAITTSDGSDWDIINANRFGPSANNFDPTKVVNSDVDKAVTSWQVPNGIYDVYFDAENMTLTVRIEGTKDFKLEAAKDIQDHEGSVDNFDIFISAPVTNDNTCGYVYVTAPEDAVNVYYQINKVTGAAVNTRAIDGYSAAEKHSDNIRFIIPLEIGSQGTLNLYYETGSMTTVPVAYSFTVEEKKIDSSAIDAFGSDNGEAIYYNLQGVKVTKPQKGIFIKVINGKNQKVLVK